MEATNPHHPTENVAAGERDVSPSPPQGSDATVSPQPQQLKNQDPQPSHQEQTQKTESSQWWSTYQKNRKSLGKEKKIFCQVPTCLQDLSSPRQFKDYHRRYRICPPHCSAFEVEIESVKVRFCQQCAFFHSLDMYDDKKKSCREMLERIRARRAATKEKKKMEEEEDYAKAAAAALGVEGNAGFPPPHHHGDNMAMILPDSNNNDGNGDNNSNYQMMMAMIQYNNQHGTGSPVPVPGTAGNGAISLLPDTTFSRNYNTVTVADVSAAFRGGPHPIYGGDTITTSSNNNNNAFIPTTTTTTTTNNNISIMNQQYRPTQSVFNGMLQTFESNHYQPQQRQQQQQQVNINPPSSSSADGSGLFFTANDTNTTTEILTQDLLINLSDEIKNGPNFLMDALVMFNEFQNKKHVQQQQQQQQQSQLSPLTMQLEEEPSNGQLLAVDGMGVS
jgi:hypothetical protein